MKKIMSAAVAAAVMFSMAACSATEKAEEPETSDVQTEESATEKPETSKETTEVTEETEAPVESEEDIPVYLDYDAFVAEHHHEIADDEWDYVRYCVDNGFVD